MHDRTANDTEAPGPAQPGSAERKIGSTTTTAEALAAYDWSTLHTTAGLRLHGNYPDSGFRDPRYLARRGDGQVVQLTRLLYLVLAAVDAGGGLEQTAGQVSSQYERRVTPANVAYLLATKLMPLGLVSVDTDAVPESIPRSDPLLAVNGNRTLLPAWLVQRLAAGLAPLHHRLVVAAVVAGFAAFDVLLFGFYGAITPLLAVLSQPVWIVAAIGLSLIAMVFHELGHASACHYGGAKPGPIGFGVYLIWPAAYTDVTDVYRINRTGRLRTDLGGVYFNLIFVLVLAACYVATGRPVFLAVAFITHFEMLQQLVPVVRLDGYFILGDLAGIPDLFGKVTPVLASMWPGGAPDPRIAGLRRRARVTITTWVLIVVPLLIAILGYMLWNLPRMLAVGVSAVVSHWHVTVAALTGLHVAAAVVGVVNMLLLVVPLIGVAYLLAQSGRRLARLLARWQRSR